MEPTAVADASAAVLGEIAVICCFANRGRPHHRVGGLSIDDMIGG
jgi:hypothetical protein